MAVLSSLSKADIHNMMAQAKDRLGHFSEQLDLLAGGNDLDHLEVGSSTVRDAHLRHNYAKDLPYRAAVNRASNFAGNHRWNERYLEALAGEGLSLLPVKHSHWPGPDGPFVGPRPARNISGQGVSLMPHCLIIWEWDSSYISFLGS
jgi:hypothetical protein